MKKVKWQMKENFVFPQEIGVPAAAETLKVTPRFTVEKVDERPKLSGIYHLAVNVNLESEKKVDQIADQAILIDDLDIDGKTGYFEYAVPFNIDFPPEADNPVDIQTANATSEADEAGRLSIIWDVECTYKEIAITPEQPMVQEAIAEKETEAKVSQETAAKEKASDPEVHAAAEETAKTPKAAESTAAEAHADEEAETAANASNLIVESTSFSEGDEVLAFISELEDGISTTGFRLNDVLVQGKS